MTRHLPEGTYATHRHLRTAGALDHLKSQLVASTQQGTELTGLSVCLFVSQTGERPRGRPAAPKGRHHEDAEQ